jgi:hypothetical protein
MPPAGFESTIPANKRPQTNASDREATGIGKKIMLIYLITIRV